MEAKELRIGNFVIVNRFGIDVPARIERGSEIDNCDIENYKPIPLTEEWLLKFGFRKSDDQLYFLPVPNLSMEIHAVYFRNEWLIELSNDRKNIVTEVLNLHQLQNLYLSLTDKELELK